MVLILAGLAGLYLGINWWGGGPTDEDRTIIVAEGTTLNGLGEQLRSEGYLSLPATVWKVGTRFLASGNPIRAGEFEIPKGASAARIIDILQHGRTVQRQVTIPEGMPSILVQERVQALPFMSGEAPLPEEGSVLPQTYSYQRGESRAALIRRMQEAMTRTLDELWPSRTERSVVNSREEAVTLASIVEKETAKPEERRMVAGVYSNRVRAGMRLDADPTVIYPVTKGKPLGRRILRSELDDVNDYNTYRMTGLPKGPIANPGRASIAAVLDPAPTDALYFVADGTGGHIFADTLEEHNRNVAKWYELRRKRGEM
nr:endolytic transglycosylase MltG [Sphingomicrobium lutaoense]